MGLFDFLNRIEDTFTGRPVSVDRRAVDTAARRFDRKETPLVGRKHAEQIKGDNGVVYQVWTDEQGRTHASGSDGTRVVY